jgi:prophage antirepressor-like protein
LADEQGEPWFVASDVAKVLGYKQTHLAIRDHCKAAMSTRVNRTGTSGGNPNVTIIPERDVYRLIMRSKLPQAEAFEEWVVGEVLPSIRKHGGCIKGQEQEDDP